MGLDVYEAPSGTTQRFEEDFLMVRNVARMKSYRDALERCESFLDEYPSCVEMQALKIHIQICMGLCVDDTKYWYRTALKTFHKCEQKDKLPLGLRSMVAHLRNTSCAPNWTNKELFEKRVQKAEDEWLSLQNLSSSSLQSGGGFKASLARFIAEVIYWIVVVLMIMYVYQFILI